MKKTISVKIREGNSDRMRVEQIEADVRDGWAIHRTVGIPRFWTVTHVKSGLSAEHCLHSKKRARQYRNELMAVQVNGVSLSEFATCDVLAVATVAIRQLADFYKMDADECVEKLRPIVAETTRLVCP